MIVFINIYHTISGHSNTFIIYFKLNKYNNLYMTIMNIMNITSCDRQIEGLYQLRERKSTAIFTFHKGQLHEHKTDLCVFQAKKLATFQRNVHISALKLLNFKYSLVFKSQFMSAIFFLMIAKQKKTRNLMNLPARALPPGTCSHQPLNPFHAAQYTCLLRADA